MMVIVMILHLSVVPLLPEDLNLFYKPILIFQLYAGISSTHVEMCHLCQDCSNAAKCDNL